MRLTGHVLAFATAFFITSLANMAMPGKALAQEQNMTEAEQEVLDVVKAWNNAFAHNDVEAYFSFVDEGVTVLTPNNPYRVEGLAKDREEFEYSLRSGASRVGYFQQLQTQVQLYGNTAVVTYYSRGSYGPEGEAKTSYRKETDVLVKRHGEWKVVHIHVSAL